MLKKNITPRRLSLLVASIASIVAIASGGVRAEAYAVLAYGQGGAIWYQDYAGVACGQYSPPVWRNCSLELLYDSSINSHFDWAATIDAGAVNWDIADNYKGRQLWRFRTGDQAYENSVTVYAADLGGPAPDGSIALGRASYSYICLLNPCQMTYADRHFQPTAMSRFA